MLKLTPQQVASVAQLSDQTLRHWRHVLPPLTGLNGYTPCFAPGDALALLVVLDMFTPVNTSVRDSSPRHVAVAAQLLPMDSARLLWTQYARAPFRVVHERGLHGDAVRQAELVATAKPVKQDA